MFTRKLPVAFALILALVASGNVALANFKGDKLGETWIQSQQDVPNHRTRDDRLVEVGKEVPGFGGMFLNPDNTDVLNVYLLDTENAEQEAAVEAAIKDVFPDAIPPGGIQVVQGQYNIIQLNAWYFDMRLALAKSGLVGKGLVGTDLEEDKNRLEIAVEGEEFRPKAEAAVEKAEIPREAVRITVRGPFRMLSTQTLLSKIRPVAGGLQIQADDDDICTLGFNAIRAGVNGVVVNSHCTRIFAHVDSTVFYQPTVSDSNRIGKETVDGGIFDCSAPWVGYRCRWSDAAFIKFDSGASGDMGHIARTTGGGSINISQSNPRFRVVAESSTGEVGQTIVFVGRSTGMNASLLADLCFDSIVNPSSGGTVVLLCQDIGGFPRVQGGDSGAPVFRTVDSPLFGDVRLYGILWGSSGNIEFAYSPIDQIQFTGELGNIRTCAPEIGC